MLLNSSTQSNLLSDLRASRTRQAQSRHVSLDAHDLGTSCCGSDIHHQHFVLGQLGNLGLLAILRLNTEQTSQKEIVDFDLRVDLGEHSLETEDKSDKTVGSAKSGVDAGSYTNETTWYSELQVVVLGEERDYTGEDRLALDLALFVFGDDTRSDFDFVAELQDTGQD